SKSFRRRNSAMPLSRMPISPRNGLVRLAAAPPMRKQVGRTQCSGRRSLFQGLAEQSELLLRGTIGIGEDHAIVSCLMLLQRPAWRDEDVLFAPIELDPS